MNLCLNKMGFALSKVFVFLFFLSFLSQTVLTLNGFNYKVPFNLTSSASSLTDFQVKLVLNSSNINYSNTNDDGSDLRLTWLNQSSGDEQEIPYWIEKWNESSNSIVWIKAPMINATDNNTYYYYYGNTTAVNTTSNGTATFEFFDDFNNFNKFQNGFLNSNNGDLDYSLGDDAYIDNGVLKLEKTISDTGVEADLQSKEKINTNDFILRERAMYSGGGYDWSLACSLGKYDRYAMVNFVEYDDKLKVYVNSGGSESRIVNDDIIRNEWLLIEFKVTSSSNSLVRVTKEDGSVVFGWTDIGFNLNGYDKFIWFSQGRGGAGGTHTEYGDVDKLYAYKYSTDTITQAYGTEEPVRSLLISFNDSFAFDEPIIISLSNKGKKNLTNVSVSTENNFGKLNETSFELIKPGEQKIIKLNTELTNPQIKNITIKAISNEENKTISKVVVLYNQTDYETIANIKINDSAKVESITNNFTIEAHNQGINNYNLNNFKYYTTKPVSTCYDETGKQLTTIDYKNYFEIKAGTITPEETKKINCLINSSENIITEQQREQNPNKITTSETAYSRIPLIFKNPYTSNLTINLQYDKSIVKEWNTRDSNKTLELKPNETRKEYINLNKSDVITKTVQPREQDSTRETKLDGFAYSKIPILLNNTDSIDYTLFWKENKTSTWEGIKTNGTIELKSGETAYAYLTQKKDKVIKTVTETKWVINYANLTYQEIKKNKTIINTDNISYNNITIYAESCPINFNCSSDSNSFNITANEGMIKTITSDGDNLIEQTRWMQDEENTTVVNGTAYIKQVFSVFNNCSFNFTNLLIEKNPMASWNCSEGTAKNKFNLSSNETKKYLTYKCFKEKAITTGEIKNYTNGTINPLNNYLETYALFLINNSENINFTNVALNYESNEFLNNISTKIKANANSTTFNYVLAKIPIKKTEQKIGELKNFPYSHNKLIKIKNNASFHIFNLSFNYPKGNWEDYKLYKCIYDNFSKCNLTKNSDWEAVLTIEEENKIKTKNINDMSDLTYIISYKEKPVTSVNPGSGGGGSGGGSGGSASVLFTITNITTIQKKDKVFVNITLNKNGECNYSIDDKANLKMNGSKTNWFKELKLKPGEHNLEIKCAYSLQKAGKKIKILIKKSDENKLIPLINEVIEKDKPVNNEKITTANITGLVIGSGNLLIGFLVLFFALTSYYIYSKKEKLDEIKLLELPKINWLKGNKKDSVKKRVNKVNFKEEDLNSLLTSRKKISKEFKIRRKDIEENVNLNKPLAVQRICKFIKEDKSKINYTVNELSSALNLSLISVRMAVNRGLVLNVFEKYENGKFKAYRLGKYGKKIANLEVDIKTYSELETVVNLLKKREENN